MTTEHDDFHAWTFPIADGTTLWAASCGCGHDFGGPFTSGRAAIRAALNHFPGVTGEPDRILWNRGRETVDEIVVYDATVHLEQMTDQLYWIGIQKGEANLSVDLRVAKGKSPLLCTVRDADPSWRWVRDQEHI